MEDFEMNDTEMENSNAHPWMAGHPVPQIPHLPDEVILHIFKLSMNVDSGSLRFNTAMFRANKKWNQLAQTIIWRDIVVDNAGMLLLLKVPFPRDRRVGQSLSNMRSLTVTAWPWVWSRLSRCREHRNAGELSGEGLHDLLLTLPPSLQSLELVVHGIDSGEYSVPIVNSLIHAMRKLTSLRLVTARGVTSDALVTLANGLEGIFPTLEQLSIVVSQYPKRASTPLAIQRVEILEDIAKRIATGKSGGRFPKLELGRISSYDFHVEDFGKWLSDGHGKNTVHVFDPIRNMVINSPLVRLNAGDDLSRLLWTQHITYQELNGPSRAVRHEGWQNDLPELYRPGANLIAVIGTIEDLMDVWDGHQWATSEQGVRIPRLALDGSLASRGLSVEQVNSTRWFSANTWTLTEDDAIKFLRERDLALDLVFVPDAYELVNGDDE